MKILISLLIIGILFNVSYISSGTDNVLSSISWVRLFNKYPDYFDSGKMQLANDRLFMQKNRLLTCMNPNSGETIWSVDCNYFPNTSPEVYRDKVLSSCDGKIVCYNKTTGKIEWNRECKTLSGLSNVIDNVAYLLVSNYLCQVNCVNGGIEKLILVNTEKQPPEIIQTNNEIILFYEYIGKMNILKKADFSAIFNYISKDSLYMKKLIVGNTIFIGSRCPTKGKLDSINISQGIVNWSIDVLSDVSDMEYNDNNIYTYKYCINSTNGAIIWENNELNKYVNRILYIDNNIYYINGDGSYNICDPKNGTILFSDNRIQESNFCIRKITHVVKYKMNVICMTQYHAMYMFSPIAKKVTIDPTSNYSFIDGNIKIWNDNKPIIINGITYINPIEVIEPLGGITNCLLYNNINACLFNGKKYSFIRDNSFASNGKLIPGCIIKDNVTYIPLRKATEVIGLNISWNSKTKMITVTR